YVRLLLDNYLGLGVILQKQKKQGEARKYYREAVRLAAGIRSLDPGNLSSRGMEGLARVHLGGHAFECGHAGAALAAARQAVALVDRFPREQWRAASIAMELISVYERLGRLFMLAEAREAKATLDKVEQICKEIQADDPNYKAFARKHIDNCISLAQFHE